LDCPPPQSELDQRRILSAQRRRQRRFFNRDGGGGGVSRRISAAVMNWKHPTINIEYRTSNDFAAQEFIGCWLLVVRCSMFSKLFR
jgi:hypothetical protein